MIRLWMNLWSFGHFLLAFLAVAMVKGDPSLWWLGDLLVGIAMVSMMVWTLVKGEMED